MVLSNPKAVLSQTYLRTLKYYGFEPDLSVETSTFSLDTRDRIPSYNVTATVSPVKNHTADKNTNNKIQNGESIPDKNVTFVKPKNVTTANKGIITPMYKPTTKLKQTTPTIPGLEARPLISTTEQVICPTLDVSAPLPTRINFETTIDPDIPDGTTNFFRPTTPEITTRYKPETEPTTTRKDVEETLTTTSKPPTTVIKKSTTYSNLDTLSTNQNEILETASSITSSTYTPTADWSTDFTQSWDKNYDSTSSEGNGKVTYVTTTTSKSFIPEELTTVTESTTLSTEPDLTTAQKTTLGSSTTESPVTSSIVTNPEGKINDTQETVTSTTHQLTSIPGSTTSKTSVTSSLVTNHEVNRPNVPMVLQESSTGKEDVGTTITPINTTHEDGYASLTYDDDEMEIDKIEPKNYEITTESLLIETTRNKGIIEAEVIETFPTKPTEFGERIFPTEGSTVTDRITGTVEAKVEELITTETPTTNYQRENLDGDSKRITTINFGETSEIETKMTEPTVGTTETILSNTETTISDFSERQDLSKTSDFEKFGTTSSLDSSTFTTETTENDILEVRELKLPNSEAKNNEKGTKMLNSLNKTVDLDSPVKILNGTFQDVKNSTKKSDGIEHNNNLLKPPDASTDKATVDYSTIRGTLFSDWVTESTTLPSFGQKKPKSLDVRTTPKTVEKNYVKETTKLDSIDNSTNYFEDYINGLNIELNKTANRSDFSEDDLYFSDDTERVLNVSSTNVDLSEYFRAAENETTNHDRKKRSINCKFFLKD